MYKHAQCTWNIGMNDFIATFVNYIWMSCNDLSENTNWKQSEIHKYKVLIARKGNMYPAMQVLHLVSNKKGE